MRRLSYKQSLTLFLLVFATALTALWTLTPLRDYASVQGVKQLAETFHDSWWLFAAFVGIFALGNFFFLPIPLIAFASSLIFPLWKSLLCGVIGISIAALLGYMLGRWVDVNHWPERFRKFGQFIQERLRDQAVWALILLRVAPTPPFTVTSVVAGSCRFDWLPFLFGSVIGVLPLMVLVNVLGTKILTVLEEPSTFAVLLLIAVLGLALLFILASRRMKFAKPIS